MDVSINTQRLFDQKRVQIGTGVNTTRFTSDFLQAVNRTLYDLQQRANITVATIGDVQTDIALDAEHEVTLSMGLDFHLALMGTFNPANFNDVRGAYFDALKTANMRQAMADAATYPAKLGNLDDES